MIFWYLLISAPSPIHTKDSQFECGDHGRFEYCIDGIPGCVIGCHCHPGYYFDTDSKICEPNSKLSQAYRRKFSDEPTRIYHGNSFEMLETTTYISTANLMDDHVDAIAQNTDDLGDWLYNQFFKTIEKQVINKTDNKVMTRRSGKSPIVKVTKKKFKKVRKGSSKRKHNEDLRRKLLRITEDDSLFNSDSDADTDTETEGDSSHSSSSDETRENKDKEHGHKKFVIVNKKPKPPLPSFIFLPNVETPFYPPVALPPPVLPMYPMVPVPPVLPSPYIPNVPPDCDPMETTTNGITKSQSTAQAATTSVTPLSTQLVISTTAATVTTTTKLESTSATTSIQTSTIVSRKRLKKKKRKRDKNEIIRRLQELVQHTKTKSESENVTKTPKISPFIDIEKDSIEVVEEFAIKPNKNNEVEFRANYRSHDVQQEDTPNFKYLTDLIHHLNESQKAVVTVQPSFQKLKALLDLQRNKRIMNARPKLVENTRRLNYKLNTERSNPETEFYTNLGKQIASLIRGVDTKYERQIDIEIQHNKNIPNYPMYNELNYLPNSYWERFARSPVNDVQQDEDKMKYFNKGNEALYHLENIVKMAASTRSPMSLVELENVVNVVETPLQDMQEAIDSSKIKNSHNTLNINLWPQLPLTNSLQNSVKPAIEYLKQHLNYTNDETTEGDDNSAVRPTPGLNNLSTQRITDIIDKTSNNKQNYTTVRRSNKTPKKIFFPKAVIPYFQLKPPEEPDLIMELPKKQLPQIYNRRSNAHFATMSPLFDYNPKMSFYHANSQFPMYNTEPKRALTLIEKFCNQQHQPPTSPRSYFHRELHPFDYME